MNILPKASEAFIPIEKFTKYVLDPKNSKGKHVAFEKALGYNLGNANMLIDNIKANLSNFPAIKQGDKGFGETYSVLMTLTGANGKKAKVLTAWIDDNQSKVMRLTSAYIKNRKVDEHD